MRKSHWYVPQGAFILRTQWAPGSQLSLEGLKTYQKIKVYHEAADQRNAHSVQVGVILRAMAEQE